MKFVDKDVPGPKREYVGYGNRPPKVFWPDDAKVVVSLCINQEESSEYSQPAGDNRNEGLAEIPYTMDASYRDLCAESVYEYGSRAGVWRLLRLFDEYSIKTTFYSAAIALERNPDVGAWIQKSGHEPCSHGWRWEEHWLLDRDEERKHIQWTIESFEKTVGQRPLGWYCRYGPSVNTRELLVEEGGFVYDSGRVQRRPPVLHRGERDAPPRRPVHARLQRRPLRPGPGLRRPLRLLRRLPARARRAPP